MADPPSNQPTPTKEQVSSFCHEQLTKMRQVHVNTIAKLHRLQKPIKDDVGLQELVKDIVNDAQEQYDIQKSVWEKAQIRKTHPQEPVRERDIPHTPTSGTQSAIWQDEEELVAVQQLIEFFSQDKYAQIPDTDEKFKDALNFLKELKTSFEDTSEGQRLRNKVIKYDGDKVQEKIDYLFEVANKQGGA